jgi:uncharacterized protein with beta-barrel porin domain
VTTFSGGITNGSSGSITGNVGININNVSIFSGGISNAGAISVIGDGLSVSSVSSFAGGIANSGTISAGGTGIVVSGVSTFAGGISNAGTISSAGAKGISVSGVSIFSGDIGNSGTISSGNRGLSVSGVSTFAGSISNSGAISSGATGVYLNGVSSFAGGIGNSGTISSQGFGVFINQISTFSGGINNTGTVAAGLSGFGYGFAILGTSTFSGGITNSGSISARGSDIYVAGSSVFADGITNAGTISGGAGIYVNNDSSFSGVSNAGTISAGISNSGRITASTYGIYANNISTFAGGISNSGTISTGNYGIIVGRDARSNGAAANSTFSGGIRNSGTISATGVGIYINNVSTFSGNITNAGTISAATAVSIGGAVTFAAGSAIVNSGILAGSAAAIDVSHATSPVVIEQTGGAINGAIKLSSNADVLTISGGTINGNIIGAGSHDTINFSPGAGNSFTYADSFTGINQVNINSGTVVLNGSNVASNIDVIGGTLAGTGTLDPLAVTIHSGATLQPGTPGIPGTAMTINGNLAFASGALYLVQLNSTTASLAHVSGTAMLTGGTVYAQFAAGSDVLPRYTILTATGGLGGTSFAGLTTSNLPAGVSDRLSYDAHDVYLNVTAAFSNYTGLGVNGQAVANTLTNHFNSAGSIPATFFGLSRNGLTQIDGEAATGGERSAFQLMTGFLALMLDPTAGGVDANGGRAQGFAEEAQGLPPDVAQAYASVLKAPAAASFDQPWRAWGAGFGGSSQTKGDPATGSSNVTASVYGSAAGMDYRVTPDTVLGFALAGAGTSWGLAQGLGTGRSDAFQAGLYGKSYFGPAYVSGALAFAIDWFTTNRIALGDQLTANFTGQNYVARAEAGYRYGLPVTGVMVGITPYTALQVQDFHTPSYSETDLTAGGFGLNYAATNATDTRSELGARFDNLQIVEGMPLILRGRLA